MVPTTVWGFNPHKHLKHGDCIIDEDLQKVTIGIRWAKNHQFSRELLTFPLPALQGSVLCPVAAILKVRRLIPVSDQQHLFQMPNNMGSFTYRQFTNKLRQTLKELGVQEYAAFSSHSFRRGGTTISFLCGVPTEMIKLLGNWSSDAYLSYLEFPVETRSAAYELIKLRLMAMERNFHS